MVYLKLGNFTKAEFHFRKAVDINPVNVILICCVGMMLEKLGKKDKALHQYELACKIQPLSALALFKKAQLLFSLEEYHAALIDFEYLATIAPDEASVHFLLGQLYKLANRKEDAIRRFTVALNLDPKGNHLVKEALESLAE
jgi:anaphase-promoting complex subunit 3